MKAVIVVALALSLAAIPSYGAREIPQRGELTPPSLHLDRLGATTSIWVEGVLPDGERQRHLLRETESAVTPRTAGGDPARRAFFATWDEADERWFAYSRDGGLTWSSGRKLSQELRLRDAATMPHDAMPQVAAGYALPAEGRLYVVQFRTISLPEWRDALVQLGAQILAHLPHHGHIVHVGSAGPEAIRALDFVQRIEPYHPWYRVDPELRAMNLEAGRSAAAVQRVRLTTFGWGAAAKNRVIEAARALGAQVSEYWPSGQIVELWANPEQIRILAGHDEVMWIDRWLPAETDMDLVREDAGTNWAESTYGYCGQGVRGEVMDLGVQWDHPDFDGILLHGAHDLDSHGTSTYGIVFGNGDRDGDGDGKYTGQLACAGAQGIFADLSGVTDRFAHTQELKDAPYYASFQTNSWGNGLTTAYNSYSSEMDDIIWRLDIAIAQSQSNNGNRSSRPEAWAKNVISVGAVWHYDTLDTSDDAWNSGASIGPAQDGRIKPDVSYWYDSIHTTTTNSGYTSGFGGTSAATPMTAGVVGLIVQMWADNVWETDPQGSTVFEKQPHSSTIKALLINSAQQYDFTGSEHDLTRVHQGWGRPSAREAYERASKSFVVNEDEQLQLDDVTVYEVAVGPAESELKVTMVYPDPPGPSSTDLHRVNDVNLKVTSPTGTVYHGNVGLDESNDSTPGGVPDAKDTVENVFVRNPEAGIWQVEVEAVEVNQDAYLATVEDDVTYALVVSGAAAPYTSGEGQVRFIREQGACNEVYPIRVRDGNIGSGSLTVSVWSDSEPAAESLVLLETTAGSGIYTGWIQTTDGASAPGDDILTALDGDTITVRYIDANDGAGGIDLGREDNATTDCGGPVISQVGASGITNRAASITWVTDEKSNSWVRWGDAVPPGLTEARAGHTTAHTVRLTGLSECTDYFYAVGSADPVGNSTEEDNAGAYFHFVTLKKTFGELHSCHSGGLILDAATYGCSDSVLVKVFDLDLNQDPETVESVEVFLTSSTETTPEPLTLVESGPDSFEFLAWISIAPGQVVAGDEILQTSHGDLITGRYHDADDGTGSGSVSTDTAVADCAGAMIQSVAVDDITDADAWVSWSTTKLTTGHVEWETTPALGNMATSPSLTRSHSVRLGNFTDCDQIYFRVMAVDAYGNNSIGDAAGEPYQFNAATVPGVVFRDDFDTDSGWSLEGEWEIDQPQGLGISPGDPILAYTGTRVLGHDLTGLGATPGNYEAQTTQSAISPVIDAAGLLNAELRFKRWLNVATGSIAYLEVANSGGGWTALYSTPTQGGLQESSWNTAQLDVSAYADGNSDFQFRFRQGSYIAGSSDAGWNVDQVILRDGSLPDLGACGGCIGLPTFAGVDSALDDDPCADSGVTLSWQAAPSWGSGTDGTYAVYRDTQAGFTPGPGTLVASGVTQRIWADPAPPTDQELYYLVRAENDETCGDGPYNGGATETNLVYAQARNDTSQPWPGDVGATLRLDGINRAHAQLSWSGTPDAAAYLVYRSTMPDSGFGVEGETTDTRHEDPEVYGDGQDWFYLVRAVDACGAEGP